MNIRKALIAIVAAASLAVVPSTAFAGSQSNDDCRDGSKWKDYKYAPECECECPEEEECDKDYRDRVEKKVYKEYEPKKETRQSTYQGRVLKTA